MNTPVSKSQARAMKLAGLPAADSYAAAAATLKAAGFEADGIPMGHTWRTAAKLDDSELLAAMPLAPREPGYMSAAEIAEGGY